MSAESETLNPDPEAEAEAVMESSRLFPVSKAMLFEAFRDPARLARWWGPAGFVNEFHEFDLRPGGAWKLTMKGPDGAEYANASQFVEVEEPSRIVYDHLDPVHAFRMTMIFEDTPEWNGARLTWRMVFASVDEARKVRPFVLKANEENFDRLEAELARMQAAG